MIRKKSRHWIYKHRLGWTMLNILKYHVRELRMGIMEQSLWIAGMSAHTSTVREVTSQKIKGPRFRMCFQDWNQ